MTVVTESRQMIDTFTEHLVSLRAYAKRVLVRGDVLTDAEQLYRNARTDLLFAIGRTFRFTDKEMVALIFDGMLRGPRRCGCPTCRARGESNGV